VKLGFEWTGFDGLFGIEVEVVEGDNVVVSIFYILNRSFGVSYCRWPVRLRCFLVVM